jgi:hypothetical protein
MSTKSLRPDRGPGFDEVGEFLGLTRGQLKHRVRLGVLSVTKHGVAVEFDRDQVERYRRFRDAVSTAIEKARATYRIAPMDIGL